MFRLRFPGWPDTISDKASNAMEAWERANGRPFPLHVRPTDPVLAQPVARPDGLRARAAQLVARLEAFEPIRKHDEQRALIGELLDFIRQVA